MITELDTVVLTTDLPEHGLQAGDLGTVVLLHKPSGYEVEFMTLDGETVAVVSLSPDQVRPVGRREIAHARLSPPDSSERSQIVIHMYGREQRGMTRAELR